MKTFIFMVLLSFSSHIWNMGNTGVNLLVASTEAKTQDCPKSLYGVGFKIAFEYGIDIDTVVVTAKTGKNTETHVLKRIKRNKWSRGVHRVRLGWIIDNTARLENNADSFSVSIRNGKTEKEEISGIRVDGKWVITRKKIEEKKKQPKA